MRLVFDTNVLFAAFVARKGLCASILETALAEHDLFISPFILDELSRILNQKMHIEPPFVTAALDALLAGCVSVEPIPVDPAAVGDPNDAPILGTALAAHAEVLVSGDNDLLVLGMFGFIPIVSPKEFHTRYLPQKT
jgi:putative PIN family toxin of toxin-antitoxin system